MNRVNTTLPVPRVTAQQVEHYAIDTGQTKIAATEKLLRLGLAWLEYHYPPGIPTKTAAQDGRP